MAVNFVGAVATGVTLLVVLVAKFAEGAWVMTILIPALLYLAAALAMSGIIPFIPLWVWLVGFIALNTLINYLGIQLTALVNKWMLLFELVVLVIFLVVGLVALSQGKGAGFRFTSFFNPETFSLPLIFGATSIAVLSFLGFDAI